MEAKYAFTTLLLGCLLIFAIILGSSSREDIKANWSERRCDFSVILSAHIYKPDNYAGNSSDFSSENFNYCISSMTNDYLKSIFAKMFETLKIQMGTAEVLGDALKAERVGVENVRGPFADMMDKFWNKFKLIGGLVSKIFQHLYASMKKVGGIAVSLMFLAISVQLSLMNGIDLIINVIMIILYIFMALAFIFFLPILPVMVIIILTMISINEAFPGRSGGIQFFKDYCFAPNTNIIVSGGYQKKIQEIMVGDILKDGSTVEAVVELPGPYEPLYDLYGVYVSGGHRVWSYEEEEFICVKDHPDAFTSNMKLKTLWTLITSSRSIPIRGSVGTIRFADWEELPSDPYFAKGWDNIVREMLNSRIDSKTEPPKYAPCFDMSMKVEVYQKGFVCLADVKRGDWVFDGRSWTCVDGICRREVGGGIGEKGSRISDGVWIWYEADRKWDHPSTRYECDDWRWQGMELITASGKYKIYTADTMSSYIVRDFTEVGSDRLEESYAREDELVLLKKLALEK